MTPEKSAAQGEKVVRISYHRRMYGLGEVSHSRGRGVVWADGVAL